MFYFCSSRQGKEEEKNQEHLDEHDGRRQHHDGHGGDTGLSERHNRDPGQSVLVHVHHKVLGVRELDTERFLVQGKVSAPRHYGSDAITPDAPRTTTHRLRATKTRTIRGVAQGNFFLKYTQPISNIKRYFRPSKLIYCTFFFYHITTYVALKVIETVLNFEIWIYRYYYCPMNLTNVPR